MAISKEKLLDIRVRILQEHISATLKIPTHDGGASTASDAATWEATAVALQLEINNMEAALKRAFTRLGRGRG